VPVRRYRLTPFLALRPTGSAWQPAATLEVPATKADLHVEGLAAFVLLTFLAKPRTIAEFVGAAAYVGLSENEANELFDELRHVGAVVQEATAAYSSEVQMGRRWTEYGWGAAFRTHLATHGYPFIDYSVGVQADRERMREYLACESRPPNYKDYPEAPRIVLNNYRPMRLGSVSERLRQSHKPQPSAKARGITLAELGQLLLYSFGQLGTIHWPEQGELLHKAVPSGGARHPTEAYPVLLSGEHSGAYHYSVRHHALERLEPSSGDTIQIVQALPDLERASFQPCAIVILTSVVKRAMWRYRDSRSHRAILVDLGHVLSTVRLVSHGLGIRYFAGHDIDFPNLERELCLDHDEEPVLAFVALSGTLH
jgi:SagB-type dehydrogenase family enzyme